VNFGAPYPTAAYKKYSDGSVEIKGQVKNGSALGATIFTLPSGYRPLEDNRFPITSNDAFGEIRVKADGSVICDVGSTTWVSLNGIRFSTN
jgi:hypothetical protein